MGRVVYWLNMSLDGFIETTDEGPAWAAPSEKCCACRTLRAMTYG
jgi:hypothetical protein